MSLKYVLTQAGLKMGLNPSDESERAVLLRFANEAADELYAQSDMAGSLMEQVFKVNGDQTISLPSYVGFLRAVREYSTFMPWNIMQMRPRYNQNNWKDIWRGFRLKGRQALQYSITNESIVTVIIPAADPSLTVTITGSTTTASVISEELVMTAASVSTVRSFTEITAFKKSAVTDYDVTLTDIDGKTLSVIPNNELQALYNIVDISTCPWLGQNMSKLDHYVEILYKKSLPWFSNDADEFPAPGYDNIWVNKILQLWSEEQGKVDAALAYDTKATRSLARKHEEENRATQDEVALVQNPHDILLGRLRPRRPGRYSGYSTTSRFGAM